MRRLNDERAALGRAMVLLDTAAGNERAGDGAAARVSAIREAVAVAPTFAEAYYQLALALTESGAPAAEVEAALRQALALRPGMPLRSTRLVRLSCARAMSLPHARPSTAQPRLPPGCCRRSAHVPVSRSLEKDWAAAVAALDAVVAWEPDDAAAYLDLGQALARQQKPEEAAASLRVAATLKGRRTMRPWLAGALLVTGVATPLVAQIATADRVSGKDWWPTTRTTSRDDYIGAAECVRCHPSQARQQATSMARTAWRAGESPALPAGERLQFQLGHYTYAIEKDGDRVAYSVSGGGASRSAPLAWAIGAGRPSGRRFSSTSTGGFTRRE